MATDNKNFPTLAGTEGKSEYTTLLVTVLGILALRRDTGAGCYRLRIEPTSPAAAAKLGAVLVRPWKQPGDSGQDRFSRTCPLTDDATMLEFALLAAGVMLQGGHGGQIGSCAPDAVRELLTGLGATPETAATVQHPAVERTQLVAAVKSGGVAGANSATRWGLPALRAKAPKS